MKSIRSFLLRRLLGGASLVLLAAGATVSLLVARSFEAQFDRSLAEGVQAFAAMLFQVGDQIEFEFSEELMPEYASAERPAYFQLALEGGPVFERSTSLGDRDLSIPRSGEETPRLWTASLPDGREGRYIDQVVEIHHVYPEEGPDRPKAARVRIVLARDRAELVAAERELLLQAGLTCIVLVALIGFLSWTAVNRGLEPAQRFAAAVDALDVQHLPDSLDVPDLPIELRPVAEKTNALVRRVDAALRRERRTTADIAHELRTPISEILTASEVALRDTRDPEAARRALAVAREVAWRMARSVATLLKLARLEMGAEHFERERVELGALVEEGFRSLAPLAQERSLRAENLVRAQDSVLGDREVLRIVVSNLLANAFAYTPVAGRVACRIEDRNDRWHLIVENDAGGLVPEDLALLAEPFWRKDRARSDRSRSGLGLALSSALAQRSGLELTFELAEGRFRAILAGDDHGAGGLPGESGSPASTSVRTPTGRSLADVSPRSLG